MKTPAELTALKNNWMGDPCWDIYSTEGFEEYRDELEKFQAAQEKIWADARREELMKRSIELGIGGNTLLVKFIETLERRIEQLEESGESIAETVRHNADANRYTKARLGRLESK